MGATSVTGVSGIGSAEGKIKGPGNGRNTFVPLVGPRVLVAGSKVLAAGAAVVKVGGLLPAGAAANFMVLASAAHAVTVTKANDGDGNFETITFAGTGTDVVDYIIVNKAVA